MPPQPTLTLEHILHLSLLIVKHATISIGSFKFTLLRHHRNSRSLLRGAEDLSSAGAVRIWMPHADACLNDLEWSDF